MAFENIHQEAPAMTQATTESSNINEAILNYEKQLTGIAEMVKNVWGGQAKVAFDAKHQEIVGHLGTNAADALGISEGTRASAQYATGADLDSQQIINAINRTA
ncbi:hypothetical protein [Actinophytocola sp.]|uniref:hypothetical protein n=1 Tax=Actinophytocola sp. TaxID=1872138 RepID=UPI002ED11372